MSEMAQGGLPPELMALLAGGGQAPQAPMGDAGGAPPMPMGGAPGGSPMGDGAAPQESGEGDTTDLIRQALELVRQYASQEETEQNVLNAEKITTLLQTILATEEKELEDAMQGKASPRMLRSAYGG